MTVRGALTISFINPLASRMLPGVARAKIYSKVWTSYRGDAMISVLTELFYVRYPAILVVTIDVEGKQ